VTDRDEHGRPGTDIKLTPQTTRRGLHVIGTERHTARADRQQLRGRSGRPGRPGPAGFYVSYKMSDENSPRECEINLALSTSLIDAIFALQQIRKAFSLFSTLVVPTSTGPAFLGGLLDLLRMLSHFSRSVR